MTDPHDPFRGQPRGYPPPVPDDRGMPGHQDPGIWAYQSTPPPVYPPHNRYPGPAAAAYRFAPRPPNSGTTIAAAVLALLAGLAGLFATYDTIRLVAKYRPGPASTYRVLLFDPIPAAAMTVLLLTGATLLLARRRAGRIITIIGCVVAVFAAVLSLVVTFRPVTLPGQDACYLVGALFAVLAVPFAAVGSTDRWLAGSTARPPNAARIDMPQ